METDTSTSPSVYSTSQAATPEPVSDARDALRDAYSTTASPAPTPGLRESVGKVLEAYPEMPHLPRDQAALFEQLGAAYDSAPPSDPVVTHAQLAAVVEAMISETTRVCGTQGYASTYISALHDVWRRVTCGQVPPVAEWNEKAAKWDAAVERAKDRTPLVDVFCDASGEESVSGEGCLAVGRYVLGLTLPTGPGGGETTRTTDEDGLCPECGEWTPAGHPEAHDHTPGCKATPRARIAPTPKPEEES